MIIEVDDDLLLLNSHAHVLHAAIFWGSRESSLEDLLNPVFASERWLLLHTPIEVRPAPTRSHNIPGGTS